MQVTSEQVKAAIKTAGITKLHVHNCSMCGYPCGYVFDGDRVGYDVGCDCTRGGPNIEDRTFEDIAHWVNMQSHEESAQRIWRDINGGIIPNHPEE